MNCSHCNEPCDTSIKENDAHFCCEGCKTVYGILHSSGLEEYYQLNDKPGISLKNSELGKYSYLEDASILEKLVDFQEEGQVKIRLLIPKIHCSSCIYLLEKLYELKKGIQTSKVNFNKKEISIFYDKNVVSLREIVELLAAIGYPPELRLEQVVGARKKSDRRLWYQLGLAGFVFGNIMLFSFPEYLGMAEDTENNYATFFGYLNIILIIPVVLYSGKDYFVSAWGGLKEKYLNIDVPISLGILVLFLRSVYEIISFTGAGYLDSLAGLIFFLLVGKWFQQQTYARLSFERDYKSYFPISTTKIENNKETPQAINLLEKGDIIRIRHGELIPTDAILKKGVANIDYSFVTGEAVPIAKNIGDKLYAGGRQVGAVIELEVLEKVEQSYLTQLWNDDAFSKDNKAPSQTLTDRVAQNFTIIILIIAIATLVYWWQIDTRLAFNATTAVLIIACPCALALSAPFVYGNVMRILGRRNCYLRNTHVVEDLAGIQHIVFDKTGTITHTTKEETDKNTLQLTEKEQQWVKTATYHSLHPVSKAIYNILPDIPIVEIEHFEEITGQGIQVKIQGDEVKIGSGKFLGLPHKKGTLICINGEIKDTFLQQGKYRAGVKNLLTELSQDYRLSLLTGDDDKEREQLKTLFGEDKYLHFRQSPQDKLNYIKALQNEENVMMIGDGLNDAGALQQSQVGMVLTEHINNFVPASDIILQAEKMNEIPRFIAFTKQSIRLLYVAYIISFIYNIIGISFAVQGLLSPVVAAILMPLSSITTLVFGIVSTNLLAYIRKI